MSPSAHKGAQGTQPALTGDQDHGRTNALNSHLSASENEDWTPSSSPVRLVLDWAVQDRDHRLTPRPSLSRAHIHSLQ